VEAGEHRRHARDELTIALAVDDIGPDRRRPDLAAGVRRHDQLLGLALRPGVERMLGDGWHRRLLGRRLPIGAIASLRSVDGDAAHVHQPGAAGAGGIDRRAGAADVGRAVRLPVAGSGGDRGRGVEDDIAALRRRRERCRIEDVAADEVRGAELAEPGGVPRVADERSHRPSGVGELPGEVRADEPSRAGDQRVAAHDVRTGVSARARACRSHREGQADEPALARRPVRGRDHRRAGFDFAADHRQRDRAEPRRRRDAANVADHLAGRVA